MLIRNSPTISPPVKRNVSLNSRHQASRLLGWCASSHRAKEPAAGKLESTEQKGERNPDRQRGKDRGDRNDKAGPQRFAVSRAGSEFAPVTETVLEASRDDRRVRGHHRPEEKRHHRERDEPALSTG